MKFNQPVKHIKNRRNDNRLDTTLCDKVCQWLTCM